MPGFDSYEFLARAGAFFASMALLMLGAQIGGAGQKEGMQPGRSAALANVVLLACALWWPGGFIADAGAGSGSVGPIEPSTVLAAVALAGATVGTAVLARLKSWRYAGAAAIVALLGTYAYCTAVTDIAHQLDSAFGYGFGGFAVVALAGALVASHLSIGSRRTAGALQVLCAAVVASIVALGTEAAGHAGEALPGGYAQPLLTGALVLVSALLKGALGRAGSMPSAAASVRPKRTSSSAVDDLTQLPTRLHFERRLGRAMARCDAQEYRLALLFIDLDGFKPINDTYGHSVGDAVLEQVGQRLRSLSRGRDIVARVGGDEFLLLVPRIGSDEDVASIAKRIIRALSKTYAVEQRDVTISCSIGIALYPSDCNLAKLIARADAAMYAAKRAGGAMHCFYTAEMEVSAEDSFELLNDLRKALENNEMELVYQPKIDATSGKVTAAEALLRWNHPTRGQILPGVFIPLAERSGLIVSLGNWVIEDACRQGRVWRDAGLRMRVAINLSPQQMRREDVVAQIAAALDRHRIHPSLLTCEITESVAMEDTRATQETFRRLGELGAHLSIDDFGTGYSSLSYLRQLPAKELKIDRSFVMDLGQSTDARAIVDAVVKLAHALGLKVVAEGVETERQRQALVELRCDELQGYLFAKPMSARALLIWAMSDRSATSAAFRPSLFGETKQV